MQWLRRALGALVITLALTSAAFADLRVGASVTVEWKGSWYPAKILEVKDGKYKIHYDGYDASWDEWVTTARIKEASTASAWKVGDAVSVEWKGSWYPARILEVKDGKYKIHYDGYESSWDEWVTTARMKAGGGGDAWKVGDPVSVEWKGKWYPASILEVKDGKYKIHYDGYESSWDEWVTTARMRRK